MNGPKILWTIPVLGGIKITQTTLTSWIAMLLIMGAAWFLTRNLSVKTPGKRQIVLEKLVGMLYDLVEGTMGAHNLHFAPYIGTLFLSSIVGTLLGMTNILRPATADLNTTLAWALATTALTWYGSIKNSGLLAWLKGFAEPVALMTPMNIISEIANPISMSFRHFGNIAGGLVMTTLLYSALAALSAFVLQWIPITFINTMPIFQLGIPAFLSIYFDLFSGFVQALVISMLTMVYVGGANPPKDIPDENM
ncbi:MAG: F0F1 ATP synthase subunit A [Clostridia bacterium]|nr:F0F1 ATP synthase subunit A [Clostridia bacterium]